MPDLIEVASLPDTIRTIVRDEFRNIGIYVNGDDDEPLRRTRANFDWLDRQAQNADEFREVFEWCREQKKRSDEQRTEFRRALIHRSAEWLWHILSAGVAGTVTYFFTTRGHS